MCEENGLELLRRLDLDGSIKFTENIQFLVRSTALCNVNYLNLSNCELDAEAIAAIFNSHLLSELEYLGLANCELPVNSMPHLSLNKDKKAT